MRRGDYGDDEPPLLEHDPDAGPFDPEPDDDK
jgi:hypothetical protein